MIDWRRVPWSLWTYVLLTTAEILITVLTVSAPAAPLIFTVVLTLAWNFFLLRALRWLWIGTIALIVVVGAINVFTGSGTWYGTAIGLIELCLLLLPATRRFFDSATPAQQYAS
ncbi:MAG: hypothetical protein ACTHN3_10805 [Solirubrobacterales bacterium]